MGSGPTQTQKTNQASSGTSATDATSKMTGTTNTSGTSGFDNSGTSNNFSTGFSSYSPWAPAAPLLSSLLGQAGGLLTGGGTLTAAQAAGASGLEGAANTAASYNPKLASNADYALGGGGFSSGVPGIQTGYDTMLSNLTPYAEGAYTDPTKDPAMVNALNAIDYQVKNAVGSQFSGAGRGGPMSGMGGSFGGGGASGGGDGGWGATGAPNGSYANAVAAGLASGEAPVLANYVEQARNQQIGANNDILSGAINTSQGLDASAAGRMGAMTTAPGMLSDMYNPWSTMFQAGTAAQQAPVSYLSGVSSLFSPLAQEFGSSSNIGTNTGATNQTGTATNNQITTQDILNNMASNTSQKGTARGTQTTQTSQNPFMTALSGLGLLGQIATAPLGGTLTGPSLLGNWLTGSDPRMKKDIQPIGMLFDGTPVHKFKYKGQQKTRIGLMAPQVQSRYPQAVVTNPKTGMQMVDYDAATRPAAARAPMLQGMGAH